MDTPQTFTPETVRYLFDWAEKTVQAFRDWAAAVAEAMQPALETITAFYQRNRPVIEVVLGALATVEDLQHYTRWYNAHHSGRRVSWRRLSRAQRARAYVMFHRD